MTGPLSFSAVSLACEYSRLSALWPLAHGKRPERGEAAVFAG